LSADSYDTEYFPSKMLVLTRYSVNDMVPH